MDDDTTSLADEALRRLDQPEAISVQVAPGVVAALGSAPIDVVRGLCGLDAEPAPGWVAFWEVVLDDGSVVPLASRIGPDGRPLYEPGDRLVRRVGSSTTPADCAERFADRPLGRGRSE